MSINPISKYLKNSDFYLKPAYQLLFCLLFKKLNFFLNIIISFLLSLIFVILLFLCSLPPFSSFLFYSLFFFLSSGSFAFLFFFLLPSLFPTSLSVSFLNAPSLFCLFLFLSSLSLHPFSLPLSPFYPFLFFFLF